MKHLKSAEFLAKMAWLKISGRKTPLTVILNVTNSCNCRCKHCYAAYPSRDKSKEMTTEDARKLIRDLRKNGCRRISFSGGEPLLREDIGELIDYVNSLGLNSALNTNGILVPDRLDVLKKLDVLAISLDGRPEHHDILRGKGTGEKALEGVRRAADAGLCVHTNTVLHKHNLEDIDYMLNLAGECGAKAEFALAITSIFGNGAGADDVKPSDEEFRRALKHIIRRKREGARVLFSALAYESVLSCWKDFSVEGVLDGPPPEGMPKCPAGRLFCLIDADGAMWACPHLIGKVEAKNALDVGVAVAWRTAGNHPCTGCYQIYHHEFSLLMNLNARVLWNYFKTAIGHN